MFLVFNITFLSNLSLIFKIIFLCVIFGLQNQDHLLFTEVDKILVFNTTF